MEKNIPLVIRYYRPVILVAVIGLLLFLPRLLPADADQWNEHVKRFLLPLTYPDFDPDDFGMETSENDKRLLEKYKPEIYISPEGIAPINFYDDYLPHTVVMDESGLVVKEAPDRTYLKKVERTKGYCLSFTGSFDALANSESIGYAQVIREKVRFRAEAGKTVDVPMIFLRYNFVFPKSGLPAKISWYKQVGAKLLGDPELWHVLDIHGAVYIVLDQQETPVAMILAQHNYHRTYLLDGEKSDRQTKLTVSFAQRSNEPYPLPSGNKPVLHWSADTPKYIEYILTGKNPALSTGEDLVYGKDSGGVKVDYRLSFLPNRDPLYTSWIPLGDRLKLFYIFDSWYRTGPPGMDMRTWPRLKEYGELMQFWYIKDIDLKTAEFMKKNIKSFFDVNFEEIIKRNGQRLYTDLFGNQP